MSGKKSASRKGPQSAAPVDPGNDPVRRQACIELAGGGDPLLFIDGHDDAILGLADRDGDDVVVYDIKTIVGRLRKRDGMSKGDAEEFFSYNISNACMGAGSPLFVECLN